MSRKISEFIKKLDGITYPEWQKLSYIVDKAFSDKKRELDKKIKLSSDDEEITRLLSE